MPASSPGPCLSVIAVMVIEIHSAGFCMGISAPVCVTSPVSAAPWSVASRMLSAPAGGNVGGLALVLGDAGGLGGGGAGEPREGALLWLGVLVESE